MGATLWFHREMFRASHRVALRMLSGSQYKLTSTLFNVDVRLHSHGRHVSNYFAVSLSLVLAIRVAEVDCKLQLAARPSRLQPVVDYQVPTGRGSPAAVARSQLRSDFATAGQRLFCGSNRRQATAFADADCILPFV